MRTCRKEWGPIALLIEFDQYRKELSEAIRQCDGGARVVHTDVGMLGFFKGYSGREALLDAHLEALLDATGGIPCLLPTFNYDYCRTRLYCVGNDPCQVGALNEHARVRNPHQRTRTPVFHFVILGDHSFSINPKGNPFGRESTWAEAVHAEGWVCFLGTGLHANTFIHYVEECFRVGYRYLKSFPGSVVAGDGEEKVAFRFRVRPAVAGAVDYDWIRLERDLEDHGFLVRFPVGAGQLSGVSMGRLLQYWSDCLERDELYLLTPASREAVQNLYRRYGRPLTWEALEGTTT